MTAWKTPLICVLFAAVPGFAQIPESPADALALQLNGQADALRSQTDALRSQADGIDIRSLLFQDRSVGITKGQLLRIDSDYKNKERAHWTITSMTRLWPDLTPPSSESRRAPRGLFTGKRMRSTVWAGAMKRSPHSPRCGAIFEQPLAQ